MIRNYLTITYRNDQGPQIATITDTLGRLVTFHYDTSVPSNPLLTAITALLSLPFRVPLLVFNRGLAVGTGVGSVVFGLCLIVQIGFVDGLFLRF